MAPERREKRSRAKFAEPVACSYCKKTFAPQGLKSHEKSCAKMNDKRNRNRDYEVQAVEDAIKHAHQQAIKRKANARTTAAISNLINWDDQQPGPSKPPHHDYSDQNIPQSPKYADGSVGGSDAAMSIGERPQSVAASHVSSDINMNHAQSTSTVQPDSFKTEYHPSSNRPTHVESFSTYGVRDTETPPHTVNENPWHPFLSRTDFEFAEFAQKARLGHDETNEILNLISRITNSNTKLSFRSYNDVRNAWNVAATQLTPFTKHKISVMYQKESLDFDVHTRPLWDWALDLLQDESLRPHFVWDAQRLYKHDGTQFERFIHEPWTADNWWNIQSKLQNQERPGAPLCFVLYADKTHLTSSGAVKAYPVVARCANLPVDIRNGDGIGGGRIVGWLPIVPDDSEHDGKLTYTNLKRVVWHASFLKLLESIVPLSHTGFAHMCHDDIERMLFPIILILSADYEEQCIMALLRGTNSKCPCPICLVPNDEALYKHSKNHPFRTAEDAQTLVNIYNANRTEGENLLKAQGLRPLQNVFWKIAHSDPHRTLSFDRLHAFHLGLFGRHLFVVLKQYAIDLGREAAKMIDDAFSNFPRWRDLNHFSRVTNLSFTDGNKLRDVAKQILYAACRVFDRKKHRRGYLLLRVIASYLELDMYIAMDVHTETTIAAGEAELLTFEKRMEEYIAEVKVSGDDDDIRKTWNFPKDHAAKHSFQDVLAKGAARNYSTRVNEKMHGPIQQIYDLQTNGKDIAEQILRLDHIAFVSELIRQRIDTLDERRRQALRSDQEIEDSELDSDDRTFTGQFHVGSPQPAMSLEALEGLHSSDRAFSGFRQKLSKFLNQYLRAHNIPLPGGTTWLTLTQQTMIQEFRYLKLHYESFVDWKQTTDYLRCNPSFHGRPRYDCVMIRVEDQENTSKIIFGRILLIFRIKLDDRQHDLALVLPYDAPIGQRRRMDKDLGFTRVCAKPRSSSEIFSVRSFVRGALLAPDVTRTDDYFVVTTIDSDMFLRMKREH